MELASRRDSFSPARMTVVTPDGRASARKSASNKEGPVLMRRTFSRCGADWRVRRFSTNTMQPPKASGKNISKAERSKLSEVEKRKLRNSASETIERPQEIRLIRL